VQDRVGGVFSLTHFLSGKRADARRQTLAALEVAPSYERAQDLLLKLAEARP